MVIPSPLREGSTFLLVITGVLFLLTELKSVRRVNANGNPDANPDAKQINLYIIYNMFEAVSDESDEYMKGEE